MADQWPAVCSRRAIKISPWVGLVERVVQFTSDSPSQTYHSVEQSDYIAIVALTPERLIPIVRQYRPAVEQVTWELPAGLVDAGEDPAVTCRRELLEETGFPARAVHPLGIAFPCTGRLSNRIHSFFVDTGERVSGFVPELGLTTKLVSSAELVRLIERGEFPSQLHLGALLLAKLRSFLVLPR